MFLFLFLCEFRDSAGQQQTHFQDPSAGESRCRKASRMETMPPSWRILYAESFLLISGLHRSCVSLRRTHTPLQRRLLSQKEPRVNSSDCVFKCLSGRGGGARRGGPPTARIPAPPSAFGPRPSSLCVQQPAAAALRSAGARSCSGESIETVHVHTHTRARLCLHGPKKIKEAFKVAASPKKPECQTKTRRV